MTKEQEVDIAYELCETIVSFRCTSCNTHVNVHDLDTYEAAKEIIDEGWRATLNNNLYCEKCAIKKLKPRI